MKWVIIGMIAACFFLFGCAVLCNPIGEALQLPGWVVATVFGLLAVILARITTHLSIALLRKRHSPVLKVRYPDNDK